MNMNFEKYARSGQDFVKKIAAELGDEKDISAAGVILRATLHVLRDQSTAEESVQFISQRPMFIKAIYIDGWEVSGKKAKVRHLDDFVEEVYKQCRHCSISDLSTAPRTQSLEKTPGIHANKFAIINKQVFLWPNKNRLEPIPRRSRYRNPAEQRSRDRLQRHRQFFPAQGHDGSQSHAHCHHCGKHWDLCPWANQTG